MAFGVKHSVFSAVTKGITDFLSNWECVDCCVSAALHPILRRDLQEAPTFSTPQPKVRGEKNPIGGFLFCTLLCQTFASNLKLMVADWVEFSTGITHTITGKCD